MSEYTHSNNDSVTKKKWFVAQSTLTKHKPTPFLKWVDDFYVDLERNTNRVTETWVMAEFAVSDSCQMFRKAHVLKLGHVKQ
jgi:hypothetical protein